MIKLALILPTVARWNPDLPNVYIAFTVRTSWFQSDIRRPVRDPHLRLLSLEVT